MIDKPGLTHDLPTAHVAGFVQFGDLGLAKVYAQTDAEYWKHAASVEAIPDMLKALKTVVEQTTPFNDDGVIRFVRMVAQAALAKAEGRNDT